MTVEHLGSHLQFAAELVGGTHDPGHAEAHYNLARLHERAGRAEQALRHLSDYRRLVR